MWLSNAVFKVYNTRVGEIIWPAEEHFSTYKSWMKVENSCKTGTTGGKKEYSDKKTFLSVLKGKTRCGKKVAGSGIFRRKPGFTKVQSGDVQ